MNFMDKVFAGFVIMVAVGVLGIPAYFISVQQDEIDQSEEVIVTIQDSEIVLDDPSRQYGSTSSGGYIPEVRYTYDYEGRQYTSDQVYPGFDNTSTSSREWAEDVVDSYEEGEMTTGYVNPDNPSESFLVKKTTADLFGGFGVILPALGGFFFIMLLLVGYSVKFGNNEPSGDKADDSNEENEDYS